MQIPRLSEVPGLWEVDGSLVDIYILDTTLASWERFLEFAKSYPIAYSFDGDVRPLPTAEEIFGNREGKHLLSIFLGPVPVMANCHFFGEGEIELDIDPKEIGGPNDHFEVLRFVATLADLLGEPALVTPENCPDIPILSYEPLRGLWLIRG